jgi:hypothetical protein
MKQISILSIISFLVLFSTTQSAGIIDALTKRQIMLGGGTIVSVNLGSTVPTSSRNPKSKGK